MQYGFKNKKRYELVKKYLGNPPCSICLVQPMCLQMVTNPDDGYYEPVCDKPCTEADEWFNYGTCLGYIFDWKNKIDINELLLKDSKDPDKIKENIIKLKKMITTDFFSHVITPDLLSHLIPTACSRDT